MSKEILYNSDAHKAMVRGMNKIADAITSTYGPKGRNTAFTQKYDVPLVTNDGYTIAKQMSLPDKFENAGAQILKEAALKSNQTSGDGTTAAVVIAQALINEAYKNIAAGANPIFLKRGMDKAVAVVEKTLDSISKKDVDNDTVYSIATISAGNDPEVGALVRDAFAEVGYDGVFTIMDTQMAETVLRITHGCRLDCGYLSRYFVTDNVNNIGEYKDPYIFVAKDELTKIKQIYKVLEETVNADASLIIIAKDIKEEALRALAANAEKNVLKVAALKAPGYGDSRDRNLECIAAVTGATLIDPTIELNPENCGLSYCGRAGKVIVEKNITTIEQPAAPESEKVEELRKKILGRLETETHIYEKDKLEASLGIINSSMAVVEVGGASELEMFERKYRIEDAINAAKKAVEEGIVPGGGKALLLCESAVQELAEHLAGDEKTGALVINAALSAPTRQIAANSGVDASVVVNNLRNAESPSYGYNAYTDTYGDMYELKVIDPVAVIRNSFTNAASIAGTYITTGAVVSDEEKAVEAKYEE